MRQFLRLSRTLLFAALLATPAFSAPHDIYPAPEQARPDLAAALKTASATHKRVILDFGGNWCADCMVLDIYMHNAQNKPLLEKNYVLVHVNIGTYDVNGDLAQRYHIPLDKGVPALAVLNEHGTLLYSQAGGEFEKMRSMQPSSVTAFLTRWRPAQKGCSIVATTC